MSELARKASYLKSYRALPLTLHANLLELKKVFTEEKSLTPTGLVWYTNMAAVGLFWNTDL